MGLDFKERRYYDDDEEKEKFINVYASRMYCIILFGLYA